MMIMKRREPKNNKDISGVRFGRLTASKLVYKKPRYWWECVCDCGNFKLATLRQLETGATKSCGCYRREFKNNIESGQKFNKLFAISKTNDRSDSGSVMWLCKCECGSEKKVSASNLWNGYVKSCGCDTIINSVKTRINIRNEKFKNLVGKKIEEFTVREIQVSPSQKVTFICECSCGEEFSIDEKQIKYRQSCGHLLKGEYHWRYNHELTDEERRKDRYTHLPGIKKWVKEVYRRDGWRCVICNHKDTGRKGEGIVAHHLNSFRGHEDESVDLDNGTTLCEHHHKSFHSTYGYGNNTKQQFEEFRNNRKVNNN